MEAAGTHEAFAGRTVFLSFFKNLPDRRQGVRSGRKRPSLADIRQPAPACSTPSVIRRSPPA